MSIGISTAKGKLYLGVFAMSMLAAASVLSLRSLPAMADFGWSIVFYMVASALLFFIPSALVAAELAGAFPQEGGVYLWIKEAFGAKWGVTAIFLEWEETWPWIPAVLTFVASAIAYVIHPEWAADRYFIFGMILLTLWFSIWLNSRGTRLSVWLSSSGVIAGTIVPTAVMIVMVVCYVIGGHPVRVAFHDGTSLIPDLDNFNQLMMLAGIMAGLTGIEMCSVHITGMKNPGRDFPRVILIASALVIGFSIFGSLAIALVVPTRELSLAAGVCQAFSDIFHALGYGFLTPLVCLLLAYGALTMAVTWLLGPAKGIRAVADDGYIPAFWVRQNVRAIPVRIMIVQGIFSSFFGMAVLVMPTISNAFWLMSVLTIQLYMMMYLLMFAAAIRLRYSRPDLPRPYRIPGGKPGIWLVGGIAWLTSAFTIFTGFIPPADVSARSSAATLWYVGFLLAGMLAGVLIPIGLYGWTARRKTSGGSPSRPDDNGAGKIRIFP